jgi:hypothetical protein
LAHFSGYENERVRQQNGDIDQDKNHLQLHGLLQSIILRVPLLDRQF